MNLLSSFRWLFSQPRHQAPGYCPQLLERSRCALRLGKIDLAEAFVQEAGDDASADPACLNLLGLIAEARGDWRAARRLWGRASRIDRRYQPTRQNLRRHFELFQFGWTRQTVAFGDEQVTSGVSP